MFIRILWVSEALRGQGFGQRLVEMAERRATERGCRHVFLDTFSFQAPGFYEKLGYQIYAPARRTGRSGTPTISSGRICRLPS